MPNNERQVFARQQLANARQGILDAAGQGPDAMAEKFLDPNVNAWRQALKQKLAAARGTTYTYTDPTKIPGGPADTNAINITMPGGGHVFSRPAGWSKTKQGKKEKKAAKKQAGSTAGGGMSGGGMYGLAGTSGNATRITGTGSGGYSPVGGYGGWFSKLIPWGNKDD